MVAIAALLAVGLFEHELATRSTGMDQALIRVALNGGDDPQGLWVYYQGMQVSWLGGIALLWLAAVLTVYTGWDYLHKAWTFLQDR